MTPVEEYQDLLNCTSHAIILGSIFHANEDPALAEQSEQQAQKYADMMNAWIERMQGIAEVEKTDDERAEELAEDLITLMNRVQDNASEESFSEMIAVTESCRSRYGA